MEAAVFVAKEETIINRIITALVMLLILSIASPSTATAATFEELALLDLINDYRASKGLGELVLSERLTQAAAGHSLDMASKDYFSHKSLNGASFSDRIEAAGYTYSTALGENIAGGQWRAADAFAGWKSSPGHNTIMLSKAYKAVGLARAYDTDAKYQWYWTADFGGVVDTSVRAAEYSEADNWAYEYIQWLIKQGMLSGYPDGSLRPENPITRAEFSTLVAKSFKISAGGSKTFRDTKRHWAKDYIAALADLGYISGYVDGSFRPDGLITRAEMVKMLTGAGGLRARAGAPNFSDVSNHWARDYVAIAASNGIVNGYADGKFKPDASCLRAETATCVYRMVNN
ncbi:MAG: S-layer homology domain-containing protein [Candidatus Aquicultor sp.]|nr:S-layer homology domain-containing protein [Candidatus Aquicultor sp.]